jgi:hypothetical protein
MRFVSGIHVAAPDPEKTMPYTLWSRGILVGVTDFALGDKHSRHLQLNVGHYGVFHGRRWQTETYPKVRAFIRAHG